MAGHLLCLAFLLMCEYFMEIKMSQKFLKGIHLLLVVSTDGHISGMLVCWRGHPCHNCQQFFYEPITTAKTGYHGSGWLYWSWLIHTSMPSCERQMGWSELNCQGLENRLIFLYMIWVWSRSIKTIRVHCLKPLQHHQDQAYFRIRSYDVLKNRVRASFKASIPLSGLICRYYT